MGLGLIGTTQTQPLSEPVTNARKVLGFDWISLGALEPRVGVSLTQVTWTQRGKVVPQRLNILRAVSKINRKGRKGH